MSEQYWIRFDLDGIESKYVFEGNTIELPKPNEKEGFKFTGWMDDNNKIFKDKYTPTSDIVFKPIWMPDYLTTCFTKNGQIKIKKCSVPDKNKIDIPYGVSIIGQKVFSKYYNLEEISLPDSLKIIDDSAFENCQNLRKICIPKNVEKISKCAFANCKALSELTINPGLKEIDNCAFKSCEALQYLELPETITRVGIEAFRFCKSLKTIKILSETVKIGTCAFFDCKCLDKLYFANPPSDDELKYYINCYVSISKLNKNKEVNEQVSNTIEDELEFQNKIINFFKSKADILLQYDIDCNNLDNAIADNNIIISFNTKVKSFSWIFDLSTKKDTAILNDSEFKFKSDNLENKFNEVINVFKESLTIDSILKTIEDYRNDENIKDSAINTLNELDVSKSDESRISEFLESYNKNKTKTLKTELQDSIKRSIFISKQVLNAFNQYPDLKESLNEIEEKMMTSPTSELLKYFTDKKRLVYLGDLLKIRIKNNCKHRLLFCFGNKIDSARKDDIYLVSYDTDHQDFNQYKRLDPNKISYSLYKYPFKLDVNQEKISRQLNKSLICVGCAGSGKTLISANMYSHIVNDKFKNTEIVNPENLLYLTYNDHTLRSAKDLIKSMTTGVINALSITDFFKRIINTKITIIDEENFYSWWNKYIESNKLTNHQKDREISDFKNKYTSRFVYILYRGIYKGSLVNWNEENINAKHLSKDDFIKECNEQESSMSKEEIKTLIFIFDQYQEYLDDNNLIDDNDLARLVSTRKNKEISYERLIIDEVQDLTERQLEAIISCSNDNRFYLFGDQNQSINPTILDVDKIEGCFKSKDKQLNKSDEMKKSYRFTPRLATYINYLNNLRDQNIGSIGVNNIETSAIEEDEQKHKAGYCMNEKLISSFLERTMITPNSRIIVPDIETKKELVQKLGENSDTRILTIFESKGLEWDYVILYHMLTNNEKEILEILQGNAKKSTLHRMIFNEFYVGCTRAKYSFVILEANNINKEIKDKFLIDPISKITSKEEINFYLGNNNTSEDWFKEAINDFKNEQYKSAKADFKNSNDSEKDSWIELCDIMIKKDFNLENANKMKSKIETLPQAITIYEHLGNTNQVNLLKSRLREKRLTIQDIDSIFRKENLTEQEKNHIFENYKDYYDQKFKEMTVKFKNIKERIDNLK